MEIRREGKKPDLGSKKSELTRSSNLEHDERSKKKDKNNSKEKV